LDKALGEENETAVRAKALGALVSLGRRSFS